MYYGTYTCLTELILVLQNLYGSYGTYTGISEHILVFRILYVYYRTYTCISNLIHVIQNLYLFYGYESTLRYYWTYTYFTDTGVPVWFYLKCILIIHLNHSNRIRNEQVMANIRNLVETGKTEQGVPVHP